MNVLSRPHVTPFRGAALLLALLLPACENHAQEAAPPAVEASPEDTPAEATDAQDPAAVDEATATEAPPPADTVSADEAPAVPPDATPATPADAAPAAPADATAPVANDANQAQGANVDEAALLPAPAVGETAPSAAAVHAPQVATPVHPAATQVAHPVHPAVAAAAHPVQHATPAHVAAVPVAPAAQAQALRKERFRIVSERLRPPVALMAADLPRVPQTLMQLKAGDVGIGNSDASLAVNFAMKSPTGDWRNERLDPRITKEFACGGWQDCLFWMRTGAQPAVFYKLRWPTRYAIVWDTGQTRWDLRKDTRTEEH